MLQKVLYTKTDSGDGYEFEVRHVFQPSTRKTYSEHVANEPVKVIDHLCETMKDKDDRQMNASQSMNHGWYQPQQPQSRLQQALGNDTLPPQQDWDDGIPF